MRLHVCPPRLVKAPPTKILPSGWTASAKGVSFALGSNESASPVVGIEPGDLPARLSADVGEISTDQDLAVSLDRDRMDPIVRARIECAVERAVRIQPGDVVARNTQNGRETTPDDDLAVWLNGGLDNNVADRVKIERLVEPAVGFQPGDAVTRLSANAGETAAHYDFAVGLDRNGMDRYCLRSG